MAEYIDRVAIPYAKVSEFDKGSLTTRATIESLPTANVIECAEYEKLYKEYKHYRRLAEQDNKLRSKINKAIEEIEDLDPITERVGLQVKQEILNILKEI